jgi:hypothetical protein
MSCQILTKNIPDARTLKIAVSGHAIAKARDRGLIPYYYNHNLAVKRLCKLYIDNQYNFLNRLKYQNYIYIRIGYESYMLNNYVFTLIYRKNKNKIIIKSVWTREIYTRMVNFHRQNDYKEEHVIDLRLIPLTNA